jgi:adenosylhomocysteine nucleosidase
LFQHDLDARPIFEQFEIPLLQKTFIDADTELSSCFSKVISEMLFEAKLETLLGKHQILEFKLSSPKLFIGDIASGDQFINTTAQRKKISNALPSILCVEMEGAAVAQVCFENSIPFVIIRTISDVADENAHIDFLAFVKSVSSKYSVEMIRRYFIQRTNR